MTASQAEINARTGKRPSRAASDAAPDSPATKDPSSTRTEPPTSTQTGEPPPIAQAENVERILHLSVPVSATLAVREMPIESILALTIGSIIEFDVPFDSDLILGVSNRPIGRGQAVKVGEHFGLRITAIDTVRERIDAMRGRQSR